MDLKTALYALADLVMMVAGFTYGFKFIRNYQNYLLGLEWIIVASSGTNFLVYGLIGANETSPMFHAAFFLDAFSRSIGITVILVLGLMKVTHGYKPSVAADVGVFGLAIVGGAVMSLFAADLGVAGAIFYVVMNALTTLFLFYFAWRLWRISAHRNAVSVVAVTVAAAAVAGMYDFYRIPGDDQHHTIFYTLALTTWAGQMIVYYCGYRVLHDQNERISATKVLVP
ncbi:transporter [Mycobacterium sp. CBMA293]|uniref:transporter n=1 Tax=unclassified Mycolicibacterium TaxID=2636767 RepID=UPI0012DE45FC|nr:MULTISPECIES: transporter [unclassified Mycolicibacterium]MUL49861.1 transporter [Mycolicibacterium sp. CBMA 360]MUL61505.1 transporter [Mycolicibacterium sp. CBMA 335]MUL74240.1 transporter [Mycolicibacterium sp. CBMA 311]MUL97134.1 transporter [Mycolicibacterium sp. CBMA 230]MUM08197.1 transporter [Mycolicibacterium sp. CBMA 213]